MSEVRRYHMSCHGGLVKWEEDNEGAWVFSTDYDAERQRRVDTERVLGRLVIAIDAMRFHQTDGDKAEVISDITTFIEAIESLAEARAHLARYKEGSDGTA